MVGFIFRRAQPEDLKDLMEIMEQARTHLGMQGIPQWQKGYPNAQRLEKDISQKIGYVLENAEDVVAYCAITLQEEPCYKVILGKWQTEDIPYAVVHRLAVARKERGKSLAKRLLYEAEKIARAHHMGSIRIDTHEQNKTMRHLLQGEGYTYCGMIHLTEGPEAGDPRVGYEKKLK